MAAWALLTGFSAARADDNVDPASPSAAVAPLWETDAVVSLTTDPYAPDSTFNGGQYIEDAFFANQNSPTNDFEGRKVTRLGNGDLVVAALVKNPNGNQTNGKWNIGLVRYNAAGTQRVRWPNAEGYAHAGGEYIVYPKGNLAHVESIADIKAVNGRIHILYTFDDRRLPGGPYPTSTALLRLAEDGGSASNTILWPDELPNSVFAGALAAYSSGSNHYLMAVGTRMRRSYGALVGRPIFSRYRIGDSGALTDITGTVDLNTSACSNTNMECHATGIAIGGILQSNIYVSYASRYNATPSWNIVVSRISASGAGSPTWDPNNWSWKISDGGNRRDWPVGIAVRTTISGFPATFRDEVFVIAESARNCQPGIGVIKFDHDGRYVASTIVGGNNSSMRCPLASSEHPKAIAVSGNRIAVAGYGRTPSFGIGEIRDDSSLAILDTDLTLRDFRDFTFPIDGPRDRHSRFWDIVPTTGGRFVAVGDNRFRNGSDVPATLRGKSSVALLGLAPDPTVDDRVGESSAD